MNNTEEKFSLSAPVDERGTVIRLSVTPEGSHILHITHHPDYALPLLVLIISLLLTVIFLLLRLSWGFFSALFLLISVYDLGTRRPILCTIDKQANIIYYIRGGMFGLGFDSQDSSHPMSEVQCLEMKRQTTRGNDGFQIDLVLEDDNRLILSPSNLGFRECQEFSERIRDFLGAEIPIQAVD